MGLIFKDHYEFLKLLFIITFFCNSYAFWGNSEKEPQYASELHDIAENCGIRRVKMRLSELFDGSKVRPSTKDSNGKTAYEVAIYRADRFEAESEYSKADYCDYVAEQLKEYEKRYQELHSKNEQK